MKRARGQGKERGEWEKGVGKRKGDKGKGWGREGVSREGWEQLRENMKRKQKTRDKK